MEGGWGSVGMVVVGWVVGKGWKGGEAGEGEGMGAAGGGGGGGGVPPSFTPKDVKNSDDGSAGGSYDSKRLEMIVMTMAEAAIDMHAGQR